MSALLSSISTLVSHWLIIFTQRLCKAAITCRVDAWPSDKRHLVSFGCPHTGPEPILYTSVIEPSVHVCPCVVPLISSLGVMAQALPRLTFEMGHWFSSSSMTTPLAHHSNDLRLVF